MSNVMEKLLQKSGNTIAESMGAGGIQELLESQAASGNPGAAAPGQTGRRRNRNAGYLALDQMLPDPQQPRKDFADSEIQNLARSLQRHGQLQAIRVRWDAALGKYIIVSGERRYRAARLAGLSELAVEFVERELTPEQVLEDQLVENCVRQDLSDIDKGKAFRALQEKNGWTVLQLAEAVGLSLASVSKTLIIVDNLALDLQAEVKSKTLPASVAYELARLDDETAQRELAQRYQREKLTRKDVIAAVGKKTGRRNHAPSRSQPSSQSKPQPNTAGPSLRLASTGRVTIEASWEGEFTLPDLIAALSEMLRRVRLAQEQELSIDELARQLANPSHPESASPEPGTMVTNA